MSNPSDAPRWIVAHREIPGPKTMVCSHCGKLPGYATQHGHPENYCTCDQRPSDAPRTEPMSEQGMWIVSGLLSMTSGDVDYLSVVS